VAALLIGERRDDEALAELKRIRALAGDRRDLLATVAFLFDQIGATSDCVSSLDRAIVLGPDAALYVQRGLCRQHARDDKLAVEDFKAAVALNGDDGIAHCLLAEHYARRGPYNEALAASEWCAVLEQNTPLGDRAAERLRAAGRKTRP
jgi:tetratricopeptide (TPR) repeat protein